MPARGSRCVLARAESSVSQAKGAVQGCAPVNYRKIYRTPFGITGEIRKIRQINRSGQQCMRQITANRALGARSSAPWRSRRTQSAGAAGAAVHRVASPLCSSQSIASAAKQSRRGGFVFAKSTPRRPFRIAGMKKPGAMAGRDALLNPAES